MEYISIGLLCTVLAVIISYLAFSRNKTKDVKQEGQQDGVMYTEVGYIKSGIDDIKTELRDQRKVNTEMYSRMSAVEASAKQAHRRLDMIEGREYPGHEAKGEYHE